MKKKDQSLQWILEDVRLTKLADFEDVRLTKLATDLKSFVCVEYAKLICRFDMQKFRIDM